ncbi:PmoA family protein [Rathayibacter sp. KR2-224]|uniref:DUF6807 domain-containing protein n=1 Tax=Rathayibacter sp. KR2-224 TaxID=3400913 RepID=UPI003C05A4F4
MSGDFGVPLELLPEGDRSVALSAAAGDGARVELMRYVYRPSEAQYESPRPYVHPVRTLEGRLVTVFRPWDHVWHKGITLALPVVGADNFWGGPSFRRDAGGYVDLPNNGSQDYEGAVVVEQPGEGVAFGHRLTWRRQPARAGEAGESVFSENRAISAALLPEAGAWMLGWHSRLTNISGEVIEMGSPTTEGRENAGYGGLFWRGPRSFTGGDLIGSDGTKGEAVRGSRGPWTGFSGRHDGEDAASTVVFVDRTPDQRFDTKWFARSEPFACINPAPFFDRVRVVEAGETIELLHTVVIADGSSDRHRMSALAEAGRLAAERSDLTVEEIRS